MVVAVRLVRKMEPSFHHVVDVVAVDDLRVSAEGGMLVVLLNSQLQVLHELLQLLRAEALPPQKPRAQLVRQRLLGTLLLRLSRERYGEWGLCDGVFFDFFVVELHELADFFGLLVVAGHEERVAVLQIGGWSIGVPRVSQ